MGTSFQWTESFELILQNLELVLNPILQSFLINLPIFLNQPTTSAVSKTRLQH